MSIRLRTIRVRRRRIGGDPSPEDSSRVHRQPSGARARSWNSSDPRRPRGRASRSLRGAAGGRRRGWRYRGCCRPSPRGGARRRACARPAGQPLALGAPQRDRLGGQLQTGERALQLVGDRGDEVLLPLAQRRLLAQSVRPITAEQPPSTTRKKPPPRAYWRSRLACSLLDFGGRRWAGRRPGCGWSSERRGKAATRSGETPSSSMRSAACRLPSWRAAMRSDSRRTMRR